MPPWEIVLDTTSVGERHDFLGTTAGGAVVSELVPTEIRLRRASRVLEVTFDDGSRFELPFEYLRVHSPSAEVKGHGPGQEVLVLGKETYREGLACGVVHDSG